MRENQGGLQTGRAGGQRSSGLSCGSAVVVTAASAGACVETAEAAENVALWSWPHGIGQADSAAGPLA